MKNIAITGATGKVGPIATRVFMAAGFHVRALSRHPDSDTAQAMAGLGADMFQAGFDDPARLRASMADMDGVFVIIPSVEGHRDFECAKAVFDAATHAGVRHIVYLSYLSADPEHGLKTAPKQKTEAYIREQLGVPWTILRSTELMENFNISSGGRTSWRDEILTNGFRDPKSADLPRQFIAAKDLAGFACRAFQDPQTWAGQAINLAGDTIANGKLHTLIAKLIGRPVSYETMDWDAWQRAYDIPPPVVDVWKWYDKTHFVADEAALRRAYGPLQTLEDFLIETGWQDLG